ncbi:aminotransferase class I/II-fold pyridoxal phosphate-dependent enzyme, partial [Candidatus Uhrbacteria bacterium]|nr:aminotransferase class I/II-fold pyridoxal phosphate-dependent enzyme [Candidatus Uhrbacteria bacterium]
MGKLSGRIREVKPSLTLSITAKAKAMRAQGVDVISFSAGEPDFDTPRQIREAARKALKDGLTKYTPVSGIQPLKEAIAKKLKLDNNIEYSASDIVVSCGAKHSIYNVIQVLVDSGDEVIIPSPYWLSYPEMVTLAGGKVVALPSSQDTQFKITPQQLERAITPRTKILILNSPSNPTGTVYTE